MSRLDHVASAKIPQGRVSGDYNRLPAEWETQEDGIPAARYTDPAFAKLEAERLWPHVWQMACREDEVADPGDYTVYEILEDSILIVRLNDRSIKAYHNVCPHRATSLAKDCGHFAGEIVCPFHGWRWNLRGENTFILDQSEFLKGKLSNCDVPLEEVRVARWMGSVWINMDPDAISFDEHIEPLREFVDRLGVQDMRFYWWKSVRVPANWKIAQEAFHEAYHVPQTHPQLYDRNGGAEAFTGGVHYKPFRNGHSYFYQPLGLSAEMMTKVKQTREEEINGNVHIQTVMERDLDAMVLAEEVVLARSMRHREIPEGKPVYEAFLDTIWEHYKIQGRPIGDRSALATNPDVFLFPNLTFLPLFGNVLMYRSRPSRDNDPNFCEFELFSLKTYAEGETSPRPRVEHILDPLAQESFRLIPRQDFANIPRQQKGLRSRAMKQTKLNGRQEVFISNMHRHLDTYLSK